MRSDYFLTLFLQVFLEPFLCVIIGGLFILGEVSLRSIKENTEEVNSLHPLKPVFRWSSIFFFVLAAVLATDALDLLFPQRGLVQHLLMLTGVILFLTGCISFFGILVAPILGAASATSLFMRPIIRLAQGMTLTVRPVVTVMESREIQFLKIFGLSLSPSTPTSDEEVIHMMDEGFNSGIFNAAEKEMVERVLDLDEEMTSSLMTPRSQFVWLSLDDSDEENWRRIAQSGHSEFPLFQGTHDNLVGMVSVKSLWANLSLTDSVRLADVMVTPLYVSSTMTAFQLIEEFRAKKRHTALVVDEFGVVEGIVTLKDIFETIVGTLPEREVKQHYPKIFQQADGSWFIDALYNFEKASEALGLVVSEEEENRYQTLGGFFLHHLGHIPHAGEALVWKHYRFEVVAMHRQRIEQLRVELVKPASGIRNQ